MSFDSESYRRNRFVSGQFGTAHIERLLCNAQQGHGTNGMCGAQAVARDSGGVYYCNRDLDFALRNLELVFADHGDNWRAILEVPDGFSLEVWDGENQTTT